MHVVIASEEDAQPALALSFVGVREARVPVERWQEALGEAKHRLSQGSRRNCLRKTKDVGRPWAAAGGKGR